MIKFMSEIWIFSSPLLVVFELIVGVIIMNY